MLVIASDLHLTDGTSGETITPGAFRVFRERLRDLAYDASWRADGAYRPISQLDVLLLGDIFDVIRSSRWCSAPPDIRPWGNADDPRLAELVAEITCGILRNNAQSLAVLQSLNDQRTISIPPATRDGKVARVSREPDAADRLPVTVRLHYLVGNHDWFYHLPGPAFDAVRSAIVGAAGLCNSPAAPFPHDPSESPCIEQLLHDHRVVARHGDIFDSLNYEGDRNRSSLGDAIVVELLNRFPQEVAAQMGDELSPACKAGLRELDNVRPLIDIPAWLDALLGRFCGRDQAVRAKRIWDGLADQFLELEFVRRHGSILHPFSDAAYLESLLKFSRGASLALLTGIASLVKRITAGRENGFYAHAFDEAEFQNRAARFVVYGHTHCQQVVPLRPGGSDSQTPSQIYLNSGTWRAVHEGARYPSPHRQFVGYHVMTYLAFFKDDERKGRAFESWSGTLDTSGG